ncbi:hypothetical protein [Halorarum salinum]|uniref:Uncharacterized protein n=1 Tax=Halorarum salinum TaxID=2743089 RepID=A0A7D5Q9X6_9EURY|nr:hypothetical protein [Halobaculum salinum]QLG60420.1 hypothetical protein HUG12_01095 [Halobaculum salinum]
MTDRTTGHREGPAAGGGRGPTGVAPAGRSDGTDPPTGRVAGPEASWNEEGD